MTSARLQLTNDGLHGLTGGIERQGVGVHARRDAGSQGTNGSRAGGGGSQTGGDAGGETEGASYWQKHQQVLEESRETTVINYVRGHVQRGPGSRSPTRSPCRLFFLQ